MAYNTGNPVPSTEAKDFVDNVENLDKAVNSLEPKFQDRLGVKRSTYEGVVQGLSFFNVGTFAVGFTLTNSRQTLTYDGHEYGWSGVFPKVVAAGSTPTPLGSGGWIDRSDVTLRGEIPAMMRTESILFSDHNFKRCFEFDGTSCCAISPRLSALGTDDFTLVFSVIPSVLGFGIIGGLAGSVGVRTNGDGSLTISSVSVADVLTTSAASVAVGVPALVMIKRVGTAFTVSINGVMVGNATSSISFTGETAFFGSSDGVSSYASASFGLLFLFKGSLSHDDWSSYLQGFIPDSVVAGSVIFVSDAANYDSKVVLSDENTGANIPLVVKPTIALPPTGVVAHGWLDKARFLKSATPRYGNAYFFGDSQTYGFNASGNPVYTDTVAQRLLASHRWVDRYAKESNRDIQINNLAVTGSGLSTDPAQPASNAANWHPHFYAMGQMPKDWVGQAVMVPSWNNIGGTSSVLSEDLRLRLRRGIEAMIAKALYVDYGGLGVAGAYANTGIPVIAGWATTGTSGDVTAAGLTVSSNPFPISGAASNNLIRKVNLAAGQYVEFDVVDVGASGAYHLFVEAGTDGSAYTVSVGGVVKITDTCVTAQSGLWTQVNTIRNPTVGAKIRITNTGSGTVRFLGAGWGVTDSASAVDRCVIVCSTTGNLFGRTADNLRTSTRQNKAAAEAYADFGVMWCDMADGWQSGDNDGQDQAHISPQGNARLAKAVQQAEAVSLKIPSWHCTM